MNIQEQISGLFRWARDDTYPGPTSMREIAGTMEALLKENEALIEVLHQNGISVDLAALKAPAAPESSEPVQHTDPDKSITS